LEVEEAFKKEYPLVLKGQEKDYNIDHISAEIEIMLWCIYIKGITENNCVPSIGINILNKLREPYIGFLMPANDNHTFSPEQSIDILPELNERSLHFGKFKYLPDKDHTDLLRYNCTWSLNNINPFAIAFNSDINIDKVLTYRRDRFNLINRLIKHNRSTENNPWNYAKTFASSWGQAGRGKTWDWKLTEAQANTRQDNWKDGGITPPILDIELFEDLNERRSLFEY
jgi:hypothetical protein